MLVGKLMVAWACSLLLFTVLQKVNSSEQNSTPWVLEGVIVSHVTQGGTTLWSMTKPFQR